MGTTKMATEKTKINRKTYLDYQKQLREKGLRKNTSKVLGARMASDGPPGELTNSRQIASVTGLLQPDISKTARVLIQAGIIESKVGGPYSGYRLIADDETIQRLLDRAKDTSKDI